MGPRTKVVLHEPISAVVRQQSSQTSEFWEPQNTSLTTRDYSAVRMEDWSLGSLAPGWYLGLLLLLLLLRRLAAQPALFPPGPAGLPLIGGTTADPLPLPGTSSTPT